MNHARKLKIFSNRQNLTHLLTTLANSQSQLLISIEKSTQIFLKKYIPLQKNTTHGLRIANAKAEFGKNLLIGSPTKLTHDFGRGYSIDNLENMISFI